MQWNVRNKSPANETMANKSVEHMCVWVSFSSFFPFHFFHSFVQPSTTDELNVENIHRHSTVAVCLFSLLNRWRRRSEEMVETDTSKCRPAIVGSVQPPNWKHKFSFRVFSMFLMIDRLWWDTSERGTGSLSLSPSICLLFLLFSYFGFHLHQASSSP